MKHLTHTLFLIAFISLIPLNLKASTIDFESILNLGLNVLAIETENGEEPSCDYVSHPEGSWGYSITNATKVPGSLKIYSPDGDILYNSGYYEKGESGMTIKIRGNTSAYYDKKPYKIKLQKKADLLFRGNKKYNDKNWVLLNDKFLKIPMGFLVSRLLEIDWTPAGEYVNLILNGEYKGVYYMAEAVERNETARIDVSDDGYIIEHDAYWWNENGQYLDSSFSPEYNYTFKYPDYEELSSEQLERIQQDINLYESSLKDGSYADLIDLESFVKWFMGHDILGTWDGGGANFFLSKYSTPSDALFKCGPLWDFDTILNMEGKWCGPHYTSRFAPFFMSKDTPFMKVYIDLWEKHNQEIQEGIKDFIADMRNSDIWDGLIRSMEVSPYIDDSPLDIKEEALWYEAWFDSRFPWISAQLKDYKNEAGVEFITDDNSSQFLDVYNLQGVKVLSKATKEEIHSLKRGIYIIEGKKVVIK